ncbi:MAG: PLDc N-terminal domain-containing protein [Prevotella sp.]|jgi:hypothetical protein|nr:PLDc N-terminal domain-containing protein [Prevotella sp.]
MHNLLFLGNLGTGEFIIIILTFLLPIIIFLIPTVICLIDILKNEFTANNKVVWVLVVLFLNIIGVLLYLFIGRSQKIGTNP